MAMKQAQRFQAVVREAAFAAVAVGVAALSLVLLSTVAPSQVQDLCVSARSMVEASGYHWSCGAADRPSTLAPPGQRIGAH